MTIFEILRNGTSSLMLKQAFERAAQAEDEAHSGQPSKEWGRARRIAILCKVSA